MNLRRSSFCFVFSFRVLRKESCGSEGVVVGGDPPPLMVVLDRSRSKWIDFRV